jgi:predicted NAD/FAD-binding protein
MANRGRVMPFETQAAPRRIAVVGAGISGLGAAHFLAGSNSVTVYEAEPRLGGHARTVLAGRRGDQPVDTGFIVFNRPNYPLVSRLFENLGVESAPSNMSFGVSLGGGRFEYGLRDARTVLAQPSNLVRPSFFRMVRDIFRFNAGALGAANDPRMTVRELLDRMGLGLWFRERYLLPFSGAIWSTPCHAVLDFPAQALVRFFSNHGILNYSGQHQWLTLRGGSVEYVSRLGQRLRTRAVDVRTGATVAGVRRRQGGVDVRAFGGDWEPYDEVVFATHADDTLRMLVDATGVERTALGAIRYQPNEALLHADASLMPRRRRVWSSWNYVEGPHGRSDRIDLTYWMNSLQPIPHDDPMFVTLNAKQDVRDDLVYDATTFRHPVFDLHALAAQEAVRAMNGSNHTWFCGAWTRNGFHEDGLASAAEVAGQLANAEAAVIAAE